MHEPVHTEPERTAPRHPRLHVSLLAGAVALGAVVVATAFLGAGSAPAPQARQQQVAVVQPPAVKLADFGATPASDDARLLANWVTATHDNGARSFILVDKKEARAYVFSPEGRLQDSAPVLLGAAHGDEVLPGAGPKEPSQMGPEEKTTPAGRFDAEAGENADHEDVIWVDYDDGISMHRVRAHVAQERRLQRLASPAIDDNRISFGCINLPVAFYEQVARPAVQEHGAVVYVLPEVKTVRQVFGAYDVTDPAQVAAARHPAESHPMRNAGLPASAHQG